MNKINRLVHLLLLLGLLIPVAGAAEVPVYGYRVVATFPHDINSFTQGLAYRNGVLYEGTGKKGRSTLSQINLQDASVINTRRLSNRYFGEGIALTGNKIFQLTWQSHMVFVYDQSSLESITSFYNPTEGWGLAFDGENLILSDGTDVLQFIDPENFQVVGTVAVTEDGAPVGNLNELEFIAGEVWANIWMTDIIVRIDPATGNVVSKINLSGLSAMTKLGSREAVLNGIAYDSENERLLVTGKFWSNLFHIELVSP